MNAFDILNTPRLELYEDNAGALHWVPWTHEHPGTIAVPVGTDYEPGQAQEDAAAWDEWAPYFLQDHGVEIDETWTDLCRLIATYHVTDTYEGGAPRPEDRRWIVDTDHAGTEAARYLGKEEDRDDS